MPFLKRLLRYGNSIRLLNRTRTQVNHLQASVRELFDVIHGLKAELDSLKATSLKA